MQLKMQSKQIIEAGGGEYFTQPKKKAIHRNDKYETCLEDIPNLSGMR